MSNLITLVKMQLKEKLDLKKPDLKKIGLFRLVVSILSPLLKFAAVTALCAVFIIVAAKLNIFSIDGTVPQSVISLVFVFMLCTSIVSCTAGLTKAMYYSRDNAILLTLPCSPTQVYLSKLIIFLIFEIKRNFGFIVPLFVAYFITHNYPIIFYPWMLLSFVIVSVFTVSLGALLSIPTMWACNFFRQKKVLQIVSLVLTVAVVYAALIFAISLIPENIDPVATWDKTSQDIRDFLRAYVNGFSEVYDISCIMLGDPYFHIALFKPGPMFLRFAKVIGVAAVLFGLGMLIVRPLFYKMASKPFEYLKKNVRAKKNRKLPSRLSPLWVETLSLFKSIDKVFSSVGVLISVPILIYLLNKIFLAMNTRDLGEFMIVAFNVLIIMLVALNSNCSMASIYSRDGRASYLIKTQPVKHYVLLASRLIPIVVTVFASLIATMFVILSTTKLPVEDVIMLIASLILIYLAHMFFSAELDIMNPQTEIYATVGNYDNNPNEMKSTLLAFLIAFVTAGATFLLLNEGRGHVYLKLLLVGLAAAAYCAWSFFDKIKLYYKEK